MKSRTGLVALAVVVGTLTMGQVLAAQDTHTVRGLVADSAGSGIEGAMVVVLELPDSILTRFSLTEGDGGFSLTRVPTGSYLLQVTMVGHGVLRRPITVGVADVDVGTVNLQVQPVEMDELVVSVDHVPFVIQRDTLTYNAAAFVTPPNATVEELLARLPGIEVDTDGTIRAQGEEVQNVLVDGREFFGSDPTIATRNLPAAAVQNVQVFDKESDMAEFTGIPDGNEEWTINLQLLENARQGHFGQVVGGLGGGLQSDGVIESQPDGRTRYHETLNLFRFSSASQVAVLAGTNNVNQPGFAWGDLVTFSGGAGAMRGGAQGGGARGGGAGGAAEFGSGRNDGFTTTLGLGLNANHDFTDDRWIRSSYFFSDLDNLQRQTSLRQQLLGSSVSALQSSSADRDAENTTHRASVNAQYEFTEGHDVRLRGNLTVGSSSMVSVQSNRTETLEGALQNTGTSHNLVDGDDLGGSVSLTWRKRLAENGRSLVASLSSNIQEPELYGDLETTTGIVNRVGDLVTEEIFQEQVRTGRTLNLSERVSLTQPLAKGYVLEVFGQHRSVSEDKENSVVDIGSGQPVVNEELSSAYERTYSYLLGGLRFNRNTENTRLVLGLRVQGSNLDGTILDRDENIENGYTHVMPSGDLRLQLDEARTLNIRYNASTREPSMTELQPFADNTNPTRTYVGNPNLTPEYTHSLNAEYRFFDQFSFENLFANVRFSFTKDDIIQSRTYDEQAIQTVKPVNIDHSWSLAGGATYGRPVRSIGAQLNLNYNVNYTRGVELLNEAENNSRVWRNTVDASLENRDKELFEVRAGARFAFNDVEYSLNPELDQSYVDKTLYGTGTVHYGDSWSIHSTINYRMYDDDVFGDGDRNVAMLQASISKLAFDNRIELELVGFDLLNQNRGVMYTNGASFIQEQQTESLGRYVLLRVTYRLGSLGMRTGRGGMGVRARR